MNNIIMDLKAYTLDELKAYVQSDGYGNSGIVPLSPLRLKSYLSNPRAKGTDHLLFEMYIGGKLVAYRTLLPDMFYDESDQPNRFAWLSGNYVDPGHRRKGYSTRLLKMVDEYWDSRLMYTNYAPDSKAVYDQTGLFDLLVKREGARFYLRAASEELLGNRIGGGAILRTGDKTVNIFREKKLKKFPDLNDDQCAIREVSQMDKSVEALLEKAMAESLFKRDHDVFNWILQNPWITQKEVDPIPYHFSYRVNQFSSRVLKFTLPGGDGEGLLWMLFHNHKFSVPYIYADNDELYPLMSQKIIHTMISNRCAYVTIRNPHLLKQMLPWNNWFLTKKSMSQNIFAHKKLIPGIPSDKIIYDGDGDVVFTG